MNPETTSYVLGIDGGGSQLRVVVAHPDLSICGEAITTSANPNSIGHEVAAQHIRNTIQQALDGAGVPAHKIAAVGVGIAGASHRHSADWLQTTLRAVLPNAKLALSSDIEIALVGAHGKRCGILLLAGTGSVACGVNKHGDYVQVGGWGYLLGDEGSGYWIGLQALKHTIHVADGYAQTSSLDQTILDHLQIQSAKELIAWLYHSGESRTTVIAGLAPLVLNLANSGEPIALDIVAKAADALTDLVKSIQQRFDSTPLPIAFAGGILTSQNLVSSGVCQRLGLQVIPTAKYAPVMGAILMAKQAIT